MAWCVLHPRTTCGAIALLWAVIATSWWGAGPVRLLVIGATVVVAGLLSTRWQARSLRGYERRREFAADWYQRHPDEERPDWVRDK